MVWWRTLLKAVCSTLLVASLVLFIASLSFSQTLSYSNLKPVFTEVFKEQVGPVNEIEAVDFHSILIENCTASGAETIDVPLGSPEEPDAEIIPLKCEDVIASEPSDIIDLMADGMFNKIYYKEYNQSLIQILRQQTQAESEKEEEIFFVFASGFASQSFKRASNILLITVIVFIALIILLCVPKYTALTSLGTNFLVAGIPFFIVKATAIMPVPEEAVLLLSPLFAYLSTYFLIALITGIVLLAAGIVIICRQKKKQSKKQAQEKKSKKNNKK